MSSKKLLNSKAEARVIAINRVMSVLVIFGLPILVQGIRNGKRFGTKNMVDASMSGIIVNICLSIVVAIILIATNMMTFKQVLATVLLILMFAVLVVLFGSKIGHLVTRHHLS